MSILTNDRRLLRPLRIPGFTWSPVPPEICFQVLRDLQSLGLNPFFTVRKKLSNAIQVVSAVKRIQRLHRLISSKSGRQVLPLTVTPINYAIRLIPDLEKSTFDGYVEILIRINDAVNSITCNSNDILIESASFDFEGAEKHAESENISYNQKAETVTFHFPCEIPKTSTGRLKIKFEGRLNDLLLGFYRAQLLTKEYIACTQFQACDARRYTIC